MLKKQINGETYTCFTEEECSQIRATLDSFEDRLNKIGDSQ